LRDGGGCSSSFFPGIIVYLTHWFRISDRAKAIACFYIGVPGATVVGSVIAWFLALAATLGSLYWLPVFIKRLSGLPDSQVALLAAIPGVVGIVGTLLNGWHSDKAGERRWHAALPVLVAGALYLLLLLPGVPAVVAIAMMTLGLGLYYALQPVFWAIPTLILCESAAAACFGLINSVGQIGGFAGPYVVGYLNQTTGNLRASLFYIGACYVLSGGVISLLKLRLPSVDRNVGSIAVQASSAQT
jgi:ACS family tartrate transporter-like MFS transporter